jgi:hypothetical protein
VDLCCGGAKRPSARAADKPWRMSYQTSAALNAALETAPQRDWVESVMPLVLMSGALLSVGWTGLLVWTFGKLVFAF